MAIKHWEAILLLWWSLKQSIALCLYAKMPNYQWPIAKATFIELGVYRYLCDVCTMALSSLFFQILQVIIIFWLTHKKDCLACHTAGASTMCSKQSVLLSHPARVFFAPVTLSRPSRSPTSGTWWPFKTCDACSATSAVEALGLAANSSGCGLYTSPYRNSVYFKYTSSILCMYFQGKKYNWSILHSYFKKKSINEVYFLDVLHLYLKYYSVLQVYFFNWSILQVYFETWKHIFRITFFILNLRKIAEKFNILVSVVFIIIKLHLIMV